MSRSANRRGGDSARNRAGAASREIPPFESSLGGWRLPQGQTLSEFALESGFLAPQLLALDAHLRPLGGLAGRGQERRRQ